MLLTALLHYRIPLPVAPKQCVGVSKSVPFTSTGGNVQTQIWYVYWHCLPQGAFRVFSNLVGFIAQDRHKLAVKMQLHKVLVIKKEMKINSEQFSFATVKNSTLSCFQSKWGRNRLSFFFLK